MRCIRPSTGPRACMVWHASFNYARKQIANMRFDNLQKRLRNWLHRCFPNPYPLSSPPQGFDKILETYKAQITKGLIYQMSDKLLVENLTPEQRLRFGEEAHFRPCGRACKTCQAELDIMVQRGVFDAPTPATPEPQRLELNGAELNLMIVSLGESRLYIQDTLAERTLSGEDADLTDLALSELEEQVVNLRNKLIDVARAAKEGN